MLGLAMGLLGAGLALAAPLEGEVDAETLEDGGPLLDEAVDLPTRSVHLVYTGARNGVGSGTFLPDLLTQVRAAVSASGGSVSRVRAVHGVLAQEPWLLRAPDHRVAPVVDFLAGEQIRCGPAEHVAAIDTGSDVMVWLACAEKELKKIPFFVRGKAKRNTEKFAAERGMSEISVDTLYEAKAHYAR